MNKLSSGVLSAIIVLLLVVQTTRAQTLTVLHAFTGTPDGAIPFASLIQDSAGNLYGTTFIGGASCFGDSSTCGTVFKIDPAGSETIVHSFTAGSDGAWPRTSLLVDRAGNLYGTTSTGGGTGCSASFGCGTVFAISPTGRETILYSFEGGADGFYPRGSLIRDAGGNLFGTTEFGGGAAACGGGCGTVFEVDRDGNETVLYRFQGSLDGALPAAGLIRDAAGNLYGTTAAGGGGPCSSGDYGNGCGTVFRLTRSQNGKWRETVLYKFTGLDGDNPLAPLVRDKFGILYGTAFSGGSFGYGTLFKLRNRHLTTLFNFPSYRGSGGGDPYGGLIKAGQNLYGTTAGGGDQFAGVVFKFDLKTNIESELYSFPGACAADGCSPEAGLIRDDSGNLYGTAAGGGDLSCPLANGGCGVVFKVYP